MACLLTKQQPKAVSLVFSITEELPLGGDDGGAEPNFAKWAADALMPELALAEDEAEGGQLPAEERAGWRLFYGAIEATSNLLELYKKNPKLFQKLARQLSLLPCLMSWHPDAERFNRSLFESSELGEQSMYGELRHNARHLARQSWPVRYAYAIITTIDLTLDTYEPRLPEWGRRCGFGIRHPFTPGENEAAFAKMHLSTVAEYHIRHAKEPGYLVLPLWTKGLKNLRRPFNADHVLDYWSTGKEMILEEMPNFHERPEWAHYRDKRAYQHGAKPGTIQHAIFKDILAALKTIAGANHRRKLAPSVQ